MISCFKPVGKYVIKYIFRRKCSGKYLDKSIVLWVMGSPTGFLCNL
jgi:hypothetical protein